MKNFRDTVLDIIVKNNRRFNAGGKIIVAITESDLAHELRGRRWKLPASWLSDVKEAGFTVRQVQEYGDVRAHFDEPPAINPKTNKPYAYDSHQRRLQSKYTTLISV